MKITAITILITHVNIPVFMEQWIHTLSKTFCVTIQYEFSTLFSNCPILGIILKYTHFIASKTWSFGFVGSNGY